METLEIQYITDSVRVHIKRMCDTPSRIASVEKRNGQSKEWMEVRREYIPDYLSEMTR